METNKKYLSVDDISKKLHCSVQYIRKLIRDGKIPAEQVGKTWVIDANVLSDTKLLFNLTKDVEDQIRKTSEAPKIIALSFFTGAMGLDYGLEKAGIEPIIACEFEPNARKTILLNKPDIGLIGDINKYKKDDIFRYANIDRDTDVDLMFGGPPCQAFSTAGHRKGFDDDRGNVFLTFIDRVLEIRPKLAVIENVRGLLSAPYQSEMFNKKFGFAPKTPEEQKGGALSFIINKLEENGYTVTFNLYNAANYGAPQKRERIVLFCSRDGIKVPYLYPTNDEFGNYNLPVWNTLKSAIYDLNETGQSYIQFPEKRLKYYRMLSSGQNWKNLPAEVQKQAMGKAFDAGGGRCGFYRRLDWNQPAPTLVTDPTMPATDLAHPDKDRPLSVQEYKRIQQFPDDWKIFGTVKEQYRQIGNAVPVSLGYAIGRQIVKLLNHEQIPVPPADFPFSRYENTDEISFRENQKKKQLNQQKKLFESKQLLLFT